MTPVEKSDFVITDDMVDITKCILRCENAVLNCFGEFGEELTAHEVHEVDVIEAIQKQVPKKPLRQNGRSAFLCPACYSFISFVKSEVYHRYCERCGQAIDWT